MKRPASLFFALLFVLIFACGLFYIRNVFIPIHLKQILINQASAFLKRRIVVEDIDFRVPQGFRFKRLTVFRQDDPQKPFIQVDEITFGFFFPDFFHQRSVYIPSLNINGPSIFLRRDEKNGWNFADLLPGSGKQGIKINRFGFRVSTRRFLVKNGKIAVEDASVNPPLIESINNINADVRLSSTRRVIFSVDLAIPQRQADLQLSGAYDLNQKKLSATLAGRNLPLAAYFPTFHQTWPVAFPAGILASLKTAVTYENQTLSLIGDFAVRQLQIASLPSALFSIRQITGQKYAASWDGKSFLTKGNLLLSDLEIKSGTETFTAANLTSGDLFCGRTPNKIGLNGSFTVANAVFQSAGQQVQGNVIFDNFRIVREATGIKIKSDIKIPDLTVTRENGWRASGNLTLSKLRAAINPAEKIYSVKSGITLLNLSVQNAQGLNIKTNANDPDLRLDGKNAAWKITTSPQLMNSLVKTPQGFEFRGSATFDPTQLDFANHILTIAGKTVCHIPTAKIGENRGFQGNPEITFSVRSDPAQENPWDFQSSVLLSDAIIDGVPGLGQISRVSGLLQLRPNSIRAEKLDLRVANYDLTLSGALRDFDNPYADLKVATPRVDLEYLLARLPQDILAKIPGKIAGPAAGEVSFKGLISQPAQAEITAAISLDGLQIALPALPGPIDAVRGKIHYNSRQTTWEQLTATFQNRDYTLNGKFTRTLKPSIDLELQEKDLYFTAKVNLLNQVFQIDACQGRYLTSDFDFKGDIKLDPSGNHFFDMRTNLALNLADLALLPYPPLQDAARQIDPQGEIRFNGLCRGHIRDWQKWDIKYKANADEIKLKGIPLTGMVADFEQRGEYISKCLLSADVYGGKLNLKATADLKNNKILSDITANVANADLAKYTAEKKLKNEQIAGTVNAFLHVIGPLNAPKSLKGQGTLKITNGYLWRWDILDGLFKALLIPEFQNIYFTGANADFKINNGKIGTDNLKLTGNVLSLAGTGWMDFNGNLRFNIVPHFDITLIEQSQSLQKIPTQIISQAVQAKISGTLAKPAYLIEPLPLKVLEETTDIIRQGVQNILGELF
ncbi:MAG: DUF748 domain-containing protein [Candidatus Omnitrophica bacterium]|nr:DUF748 domain-containing protein [Candidatus Omnitrophota bacterium]